MIDREATVTLENISNFSANTVTSLFLYGTQTRPEALYDRLRPAGFEGVTIQISQADHFATAGRFATPDRVPVIDWFLVDGPVTDQLPAGSYTLAQLEAVAKPLFANGFPTDVLDGFFQTTFLIEHIFLDDGQDAQIGDGFTEDFERAYVLGNSEYELDVQPNLQFVVTESGERFVENVRIVANPDNFDFIGGSPASDTFNAIAEPLIDPYQIGVRVNIEYTNPQSAPIRNRYTQVDFNNDRIQRNNNEQAFDPVAGAINDINDLVLGFEEDNVIQYDVNEVNGFLIRYGTNDSNEFTELFIGLNAISTDVRDLILGGAGDDILDGGLETDRIYGHEGDDNLIGGVGNDSLFGGSGNDQITGGKDNDLLFGDISDENYLGAEEPNGTHGNDQIDGGQGEDTLVGGGGADMLNGGEDNDTLIGDGALADMSSLTPQNPGDDTLDGGEGADTADYTLAGNATEQGITVTISDQQTEDGQPIILVTDPYGFTDTLISIENIIGTAFDDTVDVVALEALGVTYISGGGIDQYRVVPIDGELEGAPSPTRIFDEDGFQLMKT